MGYRTGRLLSFIIFFIGAIATFALSRFPLGSLTDVQYFLTCWGALALLFYSARKQSKSDPGSVDLLVAAETIIGIGIGSLVIGLSIGMFRILLDPPEFQEQLSLKSLRPYLFPFAGGLMAAGLAPLLAIWLRIMEADRVGRADATESPTAADKFTGLIAEFDRFTGKVKIATDSLHGLTETFKHSGDEWHAAGKRVDAAIGSLATSIESRTADVERDIDEFRRAVAGGREGIAKTAERLAKAGERFDAAAKIAGDAMRNLGEQTELFKEKLRDGTRLLDGLRELIASVERFIKPDGRKA